MLSRTRAGEKKPFRKGEVKGAPLVLPSISLTDGGCFRALLGGDVHEIELQLGLVVNDHRAGVQLQFACRVFDGREVDVVGSSLELRVPSF